VVDAPSERHSLVMYQSSAEQRGRTMSWIAEALTRGDKVLYRAADVTAAHDEFDTAARESGQLEILDAGRSHEQTDGRHWALRELHEELLDRAHHDGYPGVLLAGDGQALHVLAPEPAERLAFEHDLERLTERSGVRALCCYDLRVEQPDLLAAAAGVHFRGVEDVGWSARLTGEHTLLVSGEIDADNAGRFGAALRGAAGHDVHTVDLAGVTLVSAAGIRAFDDAVDLLHRREQRLRLVNVSPPVDRALAVLLVADERRIDLVATAADAARDVHSRTGAVARELDALTGVLVAGPAVATALTRVAEVAVDLVAGADLASVTLRSPDGTFHTPVATDEVAAELDRLQYVFDEGPCVDAARAAGPAVAASDDLATEQAWPRFGPAAAAHGLHSVVSTALVPDAAPPRLSGALNLYSRRRGGLSGTDRDIALLLASHASLVLASTSATTRAELEAARLHTAIDSRDVIDHAMAFLMTRRGIDADEAFELLRDLARQLSATGDHRTDG
jgi:anti-anti-sigma regulatory factor